MGCDIHPYAEIKKNGIWERLMVQVPNDRNYWSFALMANVRNGYGFAGSPMGDEVAYISEPRGLPNDVAWKNSGEGIDYKDKAYCWFGDHSYSWLLLSELMAVDLKKKHLKTGVVTHAVADKFKKDGVPPEAWSGGVGGSKEFTDQYESIEWFDDLENSAWLIPKIIEKLKPYGNPEDIRIVFGFDS